MVAIGVALATFMFAMLRWQDRRVDQRFDAVDRQFSEVNRRFEILEARVDRLVEDVAEVKGSLATLHAGLRISVAEPPE